MINRSALPSISEILVRLDIPPGRRGRTRCPIHQGDNTQAFSYDDDKGQWFCFRCGIGGDAIALIEKALDTDFKGALRWLGIEPGKPPVPDPEVIRRRMAREGLNAWAKKIGRELRFEFYIREKIITRARQRLQRDPDDAYGWNWLGWALTGHAALEYALDMIGGKDEQRLEAYKHWRAAA
jgi:DNA primase